MTAPDTTPDLDLPQVFQPDAQFAVQAQQEVINRLRDEKNALEDRLIWQRAVNLQMQVEASQVIQALRAQLDAAQGPQEPAEPSPASDGDPAVPDAPGGAEGQRDGITVIHPIGPDHPGEVG